MKKKLPSTKKIYRILAIIIFSILLLPIFSTAPQKALAVGVLFVPTNDTLLNVTATGILTSKTLEDGRWTWKKVANAAAYAAANTVIKRVSADIENRILGKLNRFVGDLKKHLLDEENKVGKKLGIQIDVINGCFPNLDLRPVPVPAWTGYKFGLSISCTPALTQKMTNFYKSDGFNWDSFKRMAENPTKYNPFGAVVAVNLELSRRQQAAKQRDLTQLGWGRGIKSIKSTLTGLVALPASIVQGMASRAFSSRLDRLQQPDTWGEALIQTVSAATSKALAGKGF